MHIHYFGQGAIISNSHEILYLNSKEYSIFDIVARNYSKNNDKEIVEKKTLRYLEAKWLLKNSSILIPRIRKFIRIIDSDPFKGDNRYTGVKGAYYPMMLTLYITNRCFHNCVHCFRFSSKHSKEMSIESVNYILNKVKGKVPNIVLSGGEPLIHYEFEKILQNLNGFATTGIVTSLYGCGTDIIKNLDIFSDIQVSIYGWDEKSHDEFTNSKGSFQEVWSNIKLIVKSGRNVTITSMNNDIRKIERIVNLCINAGVKKLQFGEIVQMGRAKLNSDKISEYALSKRIILNLQEKYHDEIEILYDEGCFSNANFSYCGAGTYKIDIDEGGNAFPCIFASRLSFSNIIKDKDIFENKVKINSSFLDYTNITCSALKNICNIY